MDTSAKAGSVEKDRSVHQFVRWAAAIRGQKASPQRTDDWISPSTRKIFTPEKGRPPPGGEEAEVVVYQPRGVGLIHPRLKAE